MDKRSKLSCRTNSKGTVSQSEESIVISQLNASACPHSTPNHNKYAPDENENSPLFQYTQETASEEMDVLWDWNSPKEKPKKTQRRLNYQQPPRKIIKRHSSNNQVQDFEKLKEELKALKEQIAIPDHEESLVLSPLEEVNYKNDNHLPSAFEPEPEVITDREFEGFFDDSLDEQLDLFTQQIEKDVFDVPTQKTSNEERLNDNKVQLYRNLTGNITNSLEDSFDFIATQIKDEDILCLTQEFNKKDDLDMTQKIELKPLITVTSPDCNTSILPVNLASKTTKNRNSFSRTKSENFCSSVSNTKVQFHRTQSFEMSNMISDALTQDMKDEIERKRREAKAKLEAKMKKTAISNSPIKFSPEEIEQKRLQALAKLQAKKQQQMIEQKREEARKKLAQSRGKNATTVKRALV